MKTAIIVDMDGTLADVSSIRHNVLTTPKDFDAFHAASVNVPAHQWVVDLVRHHSVYNDIVIVTARRAMWRHHTAWWLALNGVPSDALIMRGNKDGRPDVEVKQQMLDRWIRPAWKPILAIDDNPSVIRMWQANKIRTCVVPGWADV